MKKKGAADDNTGKSAKNLSGSKVNMLKSVTNFLSVLKVDDGSQTVRQKVPPALDPCLLLYNRGLKKIEEKSKKFKDNIELQKTMELKDCTFFPNGHSRTISKLEINDEELGNEIYQRNLNWEQQRLQRILEEQQKKKDLEIKDCSFAPLLSQPHHLTT
jgi:hypothetical protein